MSEQTNLTVTGHSIGTPQIQKPDNSLSKTYSELVTFLNEITKLDKLPVHLVEQKQTKQTKQHDTEDAYTLNLLPIVNKLSDECKADLETITNQETSANQDKLRITSGGANNIRDDISRIYQNQVNKLIALKDRYREYNLLHSV